MYVTINDMLSVLMRVLCLFVCFGGGWINNMAVLHNHGRHMCCYHSIKSAHGLTNDL